VGKHEIEIIDQYMNVKRKFELIEQGRIEDPSGTAGLKLRELLNKFLSALPDDVRSILHK